MTPGARIAAAITVLDAIGDGAAAEQALTRWARQSRFAGSKDRAAVRDHVFDALRRKRSAARYGGGTSGRALMIGLLRADDVDPGTLFDGQGHAPAPLSDEELSARPSVLEQADRWNLPDWLIPEFIASLGEEAEASALALQTRAPITLRVNRAKTNPDDARVALAKDGIETAPNPLDPNALTATQGARGLRNSRAYLEGWVELQDAASQAVVTALPPGQRCLDYCAGGGGKSLAMAAQGRRVFAHDINPDRMRDLPTRADRAGTPVSQVDPAALSSHAPFDLVLCDAPCSGSGAWRRAPHGKWTLTPGALAALHDVQGRILAEASGMVAPDGTLVYATCSVLRSENEDRIAAFLADHPGWSCGFQKRFDITQHGDGFFTAHLTRVKV